MESLRDKDVPSMEKAHAHVANAEEYESQGLLACAAPEFYKAAEMFLACMDQATNPQTKQTLKLLYNENNRRGKEIQRRIAQQREDTANLTLPRVQSSALAPTPRHASPSRINGRDNSLAMSHRTIDDSYMVLGGRPDPQDPFNQFWNKLEQMLDNLSQPVAFATVPLTSSQPYDEQEADLKPTENDSNDDRDDKPNPNQISSEEQKKLEDQLSLALEDDDEFLSDPGMDESFYLIPAVASPSMKKLQAENAQLKQELQVTRMKLSNAERAIKSRQEQERMLRDSIISVKREAQRAISSSNLNGRQPSTAIFDSLNVLQSNMPMMGNSPAPFTPERESHYLRRIRELEEELRLSRVENEKNRATIQRFRERWEKLKESAKRKRSARAAENARGDSVKETIQEEPELEE
ncbi:hypothetical protein CPB86DRAFT_661246, partial [Serendipita vermifera]